MRPPKEVLDAVQQQAWKLLEKPNVMGVAAGKKVRDGKQTDEWAVQVFVKAKIEPEFLRSRDLVPRMVSGVLTDVMETGIIRARTGLDYVPTDRIRPVPPGVSVGEESITAGTGGLYVRPLTDPTRYVLLSNAHVRISEAILRSGQPIPPGVELRQYQPGPTDGGTPAENRTGTAETYVPLSPMVGNSGCGGSQLYADIFNIVSKAFGRATRMRPVISMAAQPVNKVDCATERMLSQHLVERTVFGLGIIPTGMCDFEIGDLVEKHGRTTKRQTGKVSALNYIGVVSYGSFSSLFNGPDVIDDFGGAAFSAGGDSGSGIFKKGTTLWGALLFAGGSGKTIACKARDVSEGLGITV